MAQEQTPEHKMLPYVVVPEDSPQTWLIKALHTLFYGYRVREAQDAMANVMVEIALAYGTPLEDILAGVRTAYRFHAEQQTEQAPDPTTKRGTA